MHEISSHVKERKFEMLGIAGTDVSHLFITDEKTGKCVPENWNYGTTEWWNDSSTIIGALDRKYQAIELYNTLSGSRLIVNVPVDMDFSGILKEYAMRWNGHAFSYSYSYNGRRLDLSKCLVDNGIVCDSDLLSGLGIRACEFTPTILMEYEDDLHDL